MINSLKRISDFIGRTLQWINVAAFVALASVGLVGAMIIVGILIVKEH